MTTVSNDAPVIIEVALNGMTTRERNPHVPLTSGEIAECALRCFDGGASVIHTHNASMMLPAVEAAEQYAESWRPILDARPDALVYPTQCLAPTMAEKMAHMEPLVEKAGLRMGDVVVAIDDRAPREGFIEFSDVALASALGSEGDPVHLDVRRRGESEVIHITATPHFGTRKIRELGIEQPLSLKVFSITEADRKAGAYIPPTWAKTRPGDVIAAVDGDSVADYPALYQRIQATGGDSGSGTLISLKLRIFCGWPSSSTVKSPAARPRTGLRSRSSTDASSST